MNDGTSAPIPTRKQSGAILSLVRLMDVKKIATDPLSLKVTAKWRPFGSQAMLCGRPPTSADPTVIRDKSATGSACLGVDESKQNKFVFVIC